jgi:8-oxo-dGTP pyrophosphatase MutT (NUDIX family)
MKVVQVLPPVPEHGMKVNRVLDTSTGFLQSKSASCVFTYSNGTSKEMSIDFVDRNKGLDAVIICAWALIDENYYIYLRSCIRPALALRDWEETGRNETNPLNQWELPAGLIEQDEKGWHGVMKAASREFKEEIGAYVNPNYFKSLGYPVYSSVGISGERIYFVVTEVHPKHVETATLDGSALEENGEVVLCLLDTVLSEIDKGTIRDSKTIIGTNRLAKYLGY